MMRGPDDRLVLADAVVLLGRGVLFLISRRLGVGIFGLPAPGGTTLAWLSAIGLRDIASARQRLLHGASAPTMTAAALWLPRGCRTGARPGREPRNGPGARAVDRCHHVETA